MSGNQENTNSKDQPSMSVEDMEKLIEQSAQYAAKGLQESLSFKDILDKYNAAFMVSKPIEELSEDEQAALEGEQELAKQQFEREQKIAMLRSFLQIGIKLKSDDPNSELFRTAKELLDIVDKYESEPSSVSKYEQNKYGTGISRYKELLFAELRKHSEEQVTQQNQVSHFDTEQTSGKADLPSKKSADINIQNSNVILGDVHQPENLQIGDNTRIQKYSMIKKIGIIGAVAAFLTILHLLGWLEPIKAFIYKILLHK
jgi:hypothetical protein